MPGEVVPADAVVVARVGISIAFAGAHATGAGIAKRLVLHAGPEFVLFVARGVEIGFADAHGRDRHGEEYDGGDGFFHGRYGLMLLGIV